MPYWMRYVGWSVRFSPFEIKICDELKCFKYYINVRKLYWVENIHMLCLSVYLTLSLYIHRVNRQEEYPANNFLQVYLVCCRCRRVVVVEKNVHFSSSRDQCGRRTTGTDIIVLSCSESMGFCFSHSEHFGWMAAYSNAVYKYNRLQWDNILNICFWHGYGSMCVCVCVVVMQSTNEHL